MKVRDLQLYLRYSLSKDILLSFVRSNFLGLFLIFAFPEVFPKAYFRIIIGFSKKRAMVEMKSFKQKYDFYFLK